MNNENVLTIKRRKSIFWGLFNIIFPHADMSRVYLAFWKYIFIPSEVPECPVCMVVHETVHLGQQGNTLHGALKWWVKYIFSKKFRFSQELEAYQVQARWFDDTQGSSYKQKFLYRKEVAKILASPMYGSLVKNDEAFKLLK